MSKRRGTWDTIRVRVAAITTLFLTLACQAARAESAEVDNIIAAFVKQHCFDCHDEDTQEGELNLAALAPRFEDQHAFDAWARVYERVKKQEMPPEDSAQPSAESRAQMIAHLETSLLAAEAQRRAEAGPRGLRRLNRVEYQNTMHDLLSIDAPLVDLLPKDGSAHGFDTVADGLSISSLLLARYMEAADAAIDAAIARRRPSPPKDIRALAKDCSGRVQEGLRKNRYLLLADGQTFVRFDDAGPHVDREMRTQFDKIELEPNQRYRFRLECWPHQNDGTTLAVAVHVCDRERAGGNRTIGYYDVTGTPERPTVVEFEAKMRAGEVPWIDPYGVGGWREVLHNKQIEDVKSIGLAVRWLEVEGPLVDEWPPLSHQRLFGDVPLKEIPPLKGNRQRKPTFVVESQSPKEDAERLLRDFVPRAFRRPVEEAEAAAYVALAHDRLEAGYEFEEAMRVAYRAILCSPHFLIINRAPAKRDDYAIASRLSYFLWSTMPDEKLLELAAAARLREQAVLREQVERMLDDPRAAALTENFVGQWLCLRQINDTTPDEKLYPEFDLMLQRSMVEETESFFEELLRHDLSVLNFVDSDFSMLNERLAKHYGIAGVKGYERMQRVELPPDSHRGGVLTQAAVLKVTADGTRTSPVVRGVWVLKNILGTPPPPPPDAVPAIEPDIRGATTIREQLAKHRSLAACAQCHAKIDPAGFALESFDPIGGWRTNYRSLGEGERIEINGRRQPYLIGLPVESGDRYDGRSFGDVDAFKKLLLESPNLIAGCVAEKLLTYATGGPPDLADRVAIDRIVASSRGKNHGLRTLVHSIVQSDAFLDR